jgi:hypothetical protein
MANNYEKYPRGHDGDIDRYLMNVILLCEAMTQQQVMVHSLMPPDHYGRDMEYEFRFTKDQVSVMVRLPQQKREMVPTEIIAREVVAKLRGHWDNQVLDNVSGVLAGKAGLKPRADQYYESQVKKAIKEDSITKGPIVTKTRSPKPEKVSIPPPKKPDYQVELQKRLDAWLS